MGKIGFPELLLILLIVVLIFGAGKIPQLAKSLGEGIREFKKTMSGSDDKDKAQKKE
ncbi:MAG: twin-arginine translocase TatA/TatE family subunit [Candidatus Omnitrophica bacterium]|jgi:sec-independent protein translocase protein TatA|nr:twin-arginine translocase TatA/TatE family subunit [Candidatus Omnitrophota bacterium]